MICLLLVALSAAGTTRAADKVLQSWDFTRASDTLGWTPASGVEGFGVRDGALAGTLASDVFRLASPLFEIEAKPSQYVEVELKTDADGICQMYYSNTTDPPYGGFRPTLYVGFRVIGDGKFRTYRLFPFWQEQGKIIHIRLDPPGTHFAMRSVRIMQRESASESCSWDFSNTLRGWLIAGSAESSATPTAAGVRIRGTRDSTLISPILDIDAEAYCWVTLRIRSDIDQTAELRWATSQSSGLKVMPIRLFGDGRMHNYAVNLAECRDWVGRIVALAVSPTECSDAQSVVLQSVKLGRTPLGPPEPQVKSCRLEDPYPRVGDEPSKIAVEVVNVGGIPLKRVKTELTITGEQESRVTEERTITNLITGKQSRETTTSAGAWKCTFSGEIDKLAPAESGFPGEWKMAAKSPGRASVVCTVRAEGVEPVTYKTSWRFYPKLDKKSIAGLSYVPEPKPADTGEYLVGCYNYPGWHDYGAWSVLDAFPERKPLLGYYDCGNPEVNDWQITWALDHGISFIIYDWYWQQGYRHHEEGLHDGFLKAKYQDRMKFCLLWANHNDPGTSSYSDCIDVTKFWIDNYFRRPNYLKLGGKNVVVIFSPNRLFDDMGPNEVKRAIRDMKKLCESSGVGGLYLVGCVWPRSQWIKACADAGFDALSGYNYPSAGCKGMLVAPYSWMVDGYKEIWEQIAEEATIPYIPLCEPGWDSRPWHGPQARVRTGKTPELWQKMLANAKAFADDPSHKLPEGRKLVFLEAWNEFGEGDYIEPHREFGFEYLEAIRRVFAPKSTPPSIVLPKDIGLGPYDLPKPKPVTHWDFSDPDARTWTYNHGAVTYPGGVMHLEIPSADPMIWSPPVDIDASKLRTLEVKMRTDVADNAQLFFGATRSGFSEASSVKFPTLGDNEFHVYTVDLGANALWRGKIGALRFDPGSKPGSKAEIAYIRVR